MDPGAGLFAVFDGMGGQHSGAIPVRLSVEHLGRRAGGWSVGRDHVESVRALVQELHEIVAASHEGQRLPGWGSTVTLASFWEGWCVVGHVGDTRAYLARGGVLAPLTRDQSLLEVFMAQKAFTPEELEAFQYRNVIAGTLGMRQRFEVRLTTWRWREGDRLILCTDGLHDAVPHDRFAAIACDPAAAQDTADALVWAALDVPTTDNVCVVVVDADRPPPEGRPWAAPAPPADPFGELRSALHAHDAQGWARVVAALESTRDDPGEHARLLEYARAAVRGWPAGVRRPTPPCWLTGTWGGAPRPELALCDTLSLPDAWARPDDAWLEWASRGEFAHMAYLEPGWRDVSVNTLLAFDAFARAHRPRWVGAIAAELAARPRPSPGSDDS
jgi:protein phosphatase